MYTGDADYNCTKAHPMIWHGIECARATMLINEQATGLGVKSSVTK